MPARAGGGHALLAGALVGAVLQPDDGLPGLHGLLVELALVGGGLAGAEGGPVEAELLRAAAEGAQVVDHHVQVLGLVEVVHLQDRGVTRVMIDSIVSIQKC